MPLLLSRVTKKHVKVSLAALVGLLTWLAPTSSQFISFSPLTAISHLLDIWRLPCMPFIIFIPPMSTAFHLLQRVLGLCTVSSTTLRQLTLRPTKTQLLRLWLICLPFLPVAMLAGVPKSVVLLRMARSLLSLNFRAWVVALCLRMVVLWVDLANVRTVLHSVAVRWKFGLPALLLKRLLTYVISVKVLPNQVFLFWISTNLLLSTMTTMLAFGGPTTWPPKQCDNWVLQELSLQMGPR